MSTSYEDQTLEDWASFSFQEEDETQETSETISVEREDEQTSLPDAFVESDSPEVESSPMPVPAEQDVTPETESSAMTPPPAYQDLEIPVAEVPVYKRPHMKALFFGSGVLMVAMVVGSIMTRGSNIQLGDTSPTETLEVKEDTEKSEDELAQEKLSQLEGEVAFGTLSNRAQVLEEQKKQQILAEKLQEKEAEAEAQSQPSNTVSIPPNPRPASSASLPRLPVSRSRPATRVVPPVISSRSRPPAVSRPSSAPAPSFSAASRPSLPPAPIPALSSPSGSPAPVEQPTMVAFGAMPEESSGFGSGSQESGFQTVASTLDSNSKSDRGFSGFGQDALVAQQESAFLSGKQQFLVESGQSVLGQISNQIIAGQDASFYVQTQDAILGLPAGSTLLAQVTQFSDGYLDAEAVAVIHTDGTQSEIPANAVKLSAPNGKLLKAKRKTNFFKSNFGQALLGAGRGIADQYITRNETFFQNESSTTITRGAGSRDLASLGSSALKGFADPILNQASEGSPSGSSALLLNPGQKVRLSIQSSFVISQ